MHSIEPYYRWRDYYIASEDEQSPFFGKTYSEFYFDKKVYNYFIHPQWDEIGSETLYLKILYVSYSRGYAIIELIGEWNDCLHNDIAYLKEQVVDLLLEKEIYRYILISENVFNFHGSDDCYYEEWAEVCDENNGWICLVNPLKHVANEMELHDLHYHVYMGPPFNSIAWRPQKPQHFYADICTRIDDVEKQSLLLK